MKVFLSWSGSKSRAAAEAVREWLPYVINAVEPWMSAEDIEAGARWSTEVQSELEDTRFGILFVTAGNTSSPWLVFEAGALAKTLQDTYVCPYLLGMRPADLPGGPLSQFQAKESDDAGTWQLVQSINRALKDDAIPDARLATAFNKWWPDLQSKLSQLPDEPDTETSTERGSEDMIEEILSIARRLDHRAREQPNVYGDTTPKTGDEILRNLSMALQRTQAPRYSQRTITNELDDVESGGD